MYLKAIYKERTAKIETLLKLFYLMVPYLENIGRTLQNSLRSYDYMVFYPENC